MENNHIDFNLLSNAAKTLILALKERDMHTQMHSNRVISLSQELGLACGLTSDEISTLKLSACFHDIGKIGIRDSILLKPGKLTQEEMDLMAEHPIKGENLVKELHLPHNKFIMAAVRHHHEHFGGGGYPDKLAGEEIPILSRIISLADSYDAMAVYRSYHEAKSHDTIMLILDAESGAKHDPYLLNKFKVVIENSSHKASQNINSSTSTG